MKAKVYKLEVYDSAMDYAHGFGHSVYEVYIPRYRIAFNERDVFKLNKARYNDATLLGEIDISEGDVKTLLNELSAWKKSRAIVNTVLKKVKAKFDIICGLKSI